MSALQRELVREQEIKAKAEPELPSARSTFCNRAYCVAQCCTLLDSPANWSRAGSEISKCLTARPRGDLSPLGIVVCSLNANLLSAQLDENFN